MNSVNLIGNLTKDPELRKTASGKPVCDLRIAVNGRRGDDPVYVDVTCFDGPAAAAAEYLEKGRQVAVSGRLHFEEWEAKGGGKRSRLKVIGNVQFLGSPSKDEPAEEASEPVGAEF